MTGSDRAMGPPAGAPELGPLLDFLACGDHQAAQDWRGWHVVPIAGGANNLLYHATGPTADLAIKFTIRDVRDRAGREYHALLALEQAGLPVAPWPVALDCHAYAQPVVVQAWLPGEVKATPPVTDGEWQLLLAHVLAIHTLTPDRAGVPLAAAVVNAGTAEQAWQLVDREVRRIPESDRPASLTELLRRSRARPCPTWPVALVALCRVDANITNFVWQAGTCRSVDWENAGWGDPAFEIADWMVHPAYLDVPAERWAWLADVYSRQMGPATAVRIRTYYRIMLAWWVARLARSLYEVPQGLDRRLVERPPTWEADARAKYEHYLALANRWL